VLVLYNSEIEVDRGWRSATLIHCPECGEAIDIETDEVEEGERLSCPECDIELEVVNKQPLELDAVSDDEDEDEFDDDDEDEDEDDDFDFDDEEKDNGFR
jgi:alpha-aminoadipate carrier protein LysW